MKRTTDRSPSPTHPSVLPAILRELYERWRGMERKIDRWRLLMPIEIGVRWLEEEKKARGLAPRGVRVVPVHVRLVCSTFDPSPSYSKVT